jgi:hypothetical protein
VSYVDVEMRKCFDRGIFSLCCAVLCCAVLWCL